MKFDNHSKTPWHECFDQVLGADGLAILRATASPLDKTQHLANVQRIVACVNACEGFDTDGLILATKIGETLHVTIDRMTKRELDLQTQRDELLTALKKYEQAFDELFSQCCSNPVYDSWGKPVTALRTLSDAHWLAGKAIGLIDGAPVQTIDRLEWLESMNTLHGTVEMLYVVDGYQITQTYDGSPIGEPIHGATLAEAIDKAITAGWKPLTRQGAS